MRTLGIGVLLVVVSSSSAAAQAVSTASIGGTVRDSSGGVLPGVTVTASQTGTCLTRTITSDEAGGYTIPSLPVVRHASGALRKVDDFLHMFTRTAESARAAFRLTQP